MTLILAKPSGGVSGGGGGSGDMTKAVYDANDDGIVDEAAVITGQGDLATLDTVDTAQIDNGAVTSAKIANGTIGSSNLSTAVNNSLDLANSSVQPDDLSTVATTGDYADLTNKPDLSVYDEVEQHANLASFPATGNSTKFYLAQDTGIMYRWTGSAYSIISGQLALGETSSTAYRGDRGKTAYDHSQLTSGNPHNVTKTDVGLSNVDNTSDINKPVSTATQNALNGKANTSHTHTKSDITDFSDADYATAAQGDLADSSVQPSDIANFETTTELNTRDTDNRNRANHTGTQLASTISDFDTEVSNNTDVSANTSARHDAVTVLDTSEIDLSLTGQQLSASIVAGSIDETKLDTSVNTSLDLADSALQSADIGSTVQAYDADLQAIAGLTPSNGDVLYYNSGWQRLAKGTDDQVLTLASGVPSWADAGGGGDSMEVLWTSSPTAGTANISYQYTHNLGLTEADVLAGKYTIRLFIKDTANNRVFCYFGENNVHYIQDWDSLTSTSTSVNFWQANTVVFNSSRTGIYTLQVIKVY